MISKARHPHEVPSEPRKATPTASDKAFLACEKAWLASLDAEQFSPCPLFRTAKVPYEPKPPLDAETGELLEREMKRMKGREAR